MVLETTNPALIVVVVMLSGLAIFGCIIAYSMYKSSVVNMIQTEQPITQYLDENCTIPIERLNWTAIQPNKTYNRTIYVKNNNKYQVNYVLNVENVNPESANETFTVTWNYNGEWQETGQIYELIITLNTFEGIQDYPEISFEIAITPIEQPKGET